MDEAVRDHSDDSSDSDLEDTVGYSEDWRETLDKATDAPVARKRSLIRTSGPKSASTQSHAHRSRERVRLSTSAHRNG